MLKDKKIKQKTMAQTEKDEEDSYENGIRCVSFNKCTCRKCIKE